MLQFLHSDVLLLQVGRIYKEAAALFYIDINIRAMASVGGSRKQTNRLAQEKSPYLIQHASNPVDWYILK